MTDLSDYLAEQRSEKVKDLVQKADFSKCQAGTDMKEVYGYIVDCLSYMVKHQKEQASESSLTLLGGKLLNMKGIAVTGRDVVLLCLVAAVALVVVKEMVIK